VKPIVKTDLHFSAGEPGFTKLTFGRPFDPGLAPLIRATLAPGTWSYTPCTWQIENASVLTLQKALRAPGHRILRHAPDAPIVFDALLRLMAHYDLDQPGFTALAQVFHPDHGGTNELMAELSAARDRRETTR